MDADSFTCHFPKKLIVSPTLNARMWRVETDFTYVAGKEYGNRVIVVSKGFMTDFASVPIPFRSVLPKWGKYGWAAVVHDWLYYQGNANGGSKKFADGIILEAMKYSGVNFFVRTLIYLAVSWFGIFAWLSNKVKRKLGKEKMDTTDGNAFTYGYLPKWKRTLSEHIPDVWGEWRAEKA